MKKLVSILVILLSFALIVGCGGDEGKVKSTAKKVVAAMKKGDLDKLVKFAPKEMRDELKKLDKKQLKEIKEEFKKDVAEELKGAKFTYGDAKVDGDKASIEVTMKKDGEEDTQKFKFMKEDGKWVLEDFDF